MKKALRIAGYVMAALVAVAVAGIIYLQYAFPNVDAAPVITIEKTPALIERGEYIANHVAVCIDCHSTRDFSRFSGPPDPNTKGKGGDKFDHSLGFPGTFYARNITSDKETGIGTWTDGEVYRAITRGVSKDGSPLFPVMPYKSYSQMTTEDAYAVVAYIRTLAPIKHKVQASDPDFPVNLIMRTMPSNDTPSLLEKTALNDEVSKGEYLLTIAACNDCHTPQDKEGMRLAGGMEFPTPDGGKLRSANITPDKETGIGNWTEEAFVQRFKMHENPATVAPGGPNTIMPWSMYAGMKEEDLRAIYKYLMTVEPINNKMERFTPPTKS
ncbi:hypothetical protein GCM10027443_38770 [Pontibacter brevis]